MKVEHNRDAHFSALEIELCAPRTIRIAPVG